MSKDLADLLNLDEAWERVKKDIDKRRTFVEHPYELDLIEVDKKSWLDSLRSDLKNGQYNPGSIIICNVPKAGGVVRPGNFISIRDRVIYTACVGAGFPKIYANLSQLQGTIDFSYQLIYNPDQYPSDWIKTYRQVVMEGWRNFGQKSLYKIKEDPEITHVITTDIAAFYENIDIQILCSDLKEIGISEQVIELLRKCLYKWAQGRKGIPQGHSASDILAKLYLSSLDKTLKSFNYIHYRYVDDFRIFCRSYTEAQKILVTFIELLRTRGLNVQTAKTKIYSRESEKLKEIIEGVQPFISKIDQSIKNQRKNEKINGNNKPITNQMSNQDFPDYINGIIFEEDKEEQQNISAEKNKIDLNEVEIYRQAYYEIIEDVDKKGFNKTLFRYILNKLGSHQNSLAVDYCRVLLEKHPEETENILSYFDKLRTIAEVENYLITVLSSNEYPVYPYQIYQIIKWLNKILIQNKKNDQENIKLIISDEVIDLIYRFTFTSAFIDKNENHYLRSVCRQFLAEFASAFILDQLQQKYDSRYPLDSAEIICCLRRMEKGKRNTFLSSVEQDNDFTSRAIKLVKQSR